MTARAGTNTIKSFTVTLPKGLRFAHSLALVRKGVSLAHRPACSPFPLRHGQLTVVFAKPQRSIALTIRRPALTETSSLIKRVRAIVKFNHAEPGARRTRLYLRLGVRLTDVKAEERIRPRGMRLS